MRAMKDSELTPALIACASAIHKLGTPIGTSHAFEHEGRRYIAKLEPHENARLGKHRGVTLYYADAPLELPRSVPAPALPPTRGDVPGVPFVQARHYQAAARTDVRLIVIHVAECGEVLRAAENLQSWIASKDAPKCSWNYAVDADSATQSVRERDIAYHAAGVNHVSIGIELAGRAEQSAAQWADDYSAAVLRNAAELVAGIAMRWAIPIRRLAIEQLAAGLRGICGHADVNAVFKKSTHWDPGPGFPWADFVPLALRAQRRLVESRIPRPELRLGARGPEVAEWQAVVAATTDGAFGPKTHAATVLWQQQHGLPASGVVDGAAWALAAKLAAARGTV